MSNIVLPRLLVGKPVAPKFKRGRRAKVTTYTFAQRLLLAFQLKEMLQRNWFAGLVNPPPDKPMSLLLLSVYSFWEAGHPIHKKAVVREMGLEDIKTARKYISKAEELNLITSSRSDQDKRKELLCPTGELQEFMQGQLDRLGDQLRSVVYMLLDDPVPETGAPTLVRKEETDARPWMLQTFLSRHTDAINHSASYGFFDDLIRVSPGSPTTLYDKRVAQWRKRNQTET